MMKSEYERQVQPARLDRHLGDDESISFSSREACGNSQARSASGSGDENEWHLGVGATME
jgi:hypothetical protein